MLVEALDGKEMGLVRGVEMERAKKVGEEMAREEKAEMA
jgi:hypothetical protein